MKSKSIIALGLLGVLTIGGIKISAKTLKNTTPKNTLMTEQTIVKSAKLETNDKNLKEIAKNAFEKYFNQKLDDNNLKEFMKLYKANDEYNPYGKDYYEIVFVNEELTGANDYCVNMEPNGEIIDIGIVSKERLKRNEVTLIPLEEAKKIAADFIKENKLASEGKEVKFLGEATISYEQCDAVYQIGENTGVIVSVNSKTKKVTGFSYNTLSNVKKSIENTDFRTSGILG